MFTARIVWETGMVEERELPAGNDGIVTLRRNSLPQTGVRQVELHSKTFTARAGEEGYFLIPSVENDGASALTLFREREDTESAFRLNIMPLFAVSTASGAVLAVVEGMPFEYELVAGVRGAGTIFSRVFSFPGKTLWMTSGCAFSGCPLPSGAIRRWRAATVAIGWKAVSVGR